MVAFQKIQSNLISSPYKIERLVTNIVYVTLCQEFCKYTFFQLNPVTITIALFDFLWSKTLL